MRNENGNKPQNQQSCQNAVMPSAFYIPKIKDFYVGFECEVLWDEKHHKCTIHQDPINFYLCGFFHIREKLYSVVITEKSLKNFRVKFLDGNDIVSFGWNNGTSYNGKIFFYLNSYILIFQKDGKNISITYPIENSKDNEPKNLNNLFHGKIKNKSELKTLLQFLEFQPH
jgi:hypothetical protein